MEIILNKCYGGLDFSKECYKLYCQKKGLPCYWYDSDSYNHKYVKSDGTNVLTYCSTYDYGDEFPMGTPHEFLYLQSEDRIDPILIECVKELGERANTNYSKLEIVEIPDDMKYVIDDYDGIETLHEIVPTW